MKTCALLWDDSFLWGLMAIKALRTNGLPFNLVRSEDIRKGVLSDYAMLFVPGGWASNKIRTLGDSAVEEIKRFVRNGGSYLGFCGGAGLATEDGIGLVKIRRKPTKERVPSFSGRICLNTDAHPIWERPLDITTVGPSAVFHAWWPSQFMIDDGSAQVLATYARPLPDSFSSDLNVGDVEANGGWSEWERLYQINLDPARLLNDPAVAEATYGKGRVLLSLIHFDTPGDCNGSLVLRNLWQYLGGHKAKAKTEDSACGNQGSGFGGQDSQERGGNSGDQTIGQCLSAVRGLIDLGIRNFLWFWKNPLLLQWRRGVRGLEYCTLFALVKEIAEILRRRGNPGLGAAWDSMSGRLEEISELLAVFVHRSERLLILERYAMQNSHITYERCDDPEITMIRKELFSTSKSYGGMFKTLISEVDDLLYALLRDAETTH